MGNYFEYKMSKTMKAAILKARKAKDKKVDNQKYLCDYVTNLFGVKGVCVRVHDTL